MLNIKIVLQVFGILLLIFGGFMLFPLLCSIIYKSTDFYGFVYSVLICLGVGGGLALIKPNHNRIAKREGYLVVAGGWSLLCLTASLPYVLTGVTTEFGMAFFEGTSGLTATGATIFSDIEVLPQGILLWRSLTQWIGGMGIIVLTLAIFPLLGIGGVELFVAEAPGPTSDKIHPRIKETAKRLWLIYVGLTIILGLILKFIGKMSAFDAINHAFTTMATGGFSTKNDSIAHFNSPFIEYTILFFMFLSGMNYALIYLGLKGKLKRIWASDEFKTYFIGMLIAIIIVTFSIHINSEFRSLETAFRQAAFQLVSIITTTGYVTADYTSWNNTLTILFFFLLFTGACAGSTSGGIKVIRYLVFFKNSILEFKRLLHPKALIRTKIDKHLVSGKVVTHILVFFMIYLLLFGLGSLMMMWILQDIDQPILTALGATASCLGNVGPAIASVGPMNNFGAIPELGKFLLSGLMIVGRLELFTVLILFTPYFWKVN